MASSFFGRSLSASGFSVFTQPLHSSSGSRRSTGQMDTLGKSRGTVSGSCEKGISGERVAAKKSTELVAGNVAPGSAGTAPDAEGCGYFLAKNMANLCSLPALGMLYLSYRKLGIMESETESLAEAMEKAFDKQAASKEQMLEEVRKARTSQLESNYSSRNALLAVQCEMRIQGAKSEKKSK